MLPEHDLANIKLMIDRAETFEREFMRDYAKMEIDMLRHQSRKRALTHDESNVFDYAIEILAQLESHDTRENRLFARRKRNELKQKYLYTH